LHTLDEWTASLGYSVGLWSKTSVGWAGLASVIDGKATYAISAIKSIP